MVMSENEIGVCFRSMSRMLSSAQLSLLFDRFIII